ncbi:ferredoxin reductase [Streptomyces sp. NPDC055722]
MPVQPALRTLHSRLAGPLLKAAGWLTTPAHPDDYLALLNPLLSTRHLTGRVAAVRPETADATTLAIRPGRGWAGHRAGQYLPVGMEIDGVWHWRTYSLTSPERPGGLLRITVKAVPGGRVSPRLAHRTAPGTAVRLGPAQGDFTLPDPPPDRMLLLTAGSGITPAMGILRTLAACPEPHPDVVLVHCAPTPARMIFRTELRDLAHRQPWLRFHEHYTRPALGHLTPARLVQLCPDWDERDTWACGPAAMLDAAERHWASAGRSHRLRVERFRLAPPLPAHAADGGGRVRFTRTGTEADAGAAVPLLEVGEQAGVAMPYGCRRGICFGCAARLVHGRVRDLRTGQVHGEPGDLIQTCVSAAQGQLALEL